MKSCGLGTLSVVAAAVGAVCLAGCGGGGKTSAQTTVAILPPGLESPFHKATVDGAKKAAGELHWKVLVQAPPKESDFNEQISIVSGMVTQRVNAMSICAIDDKAIGPAIVQANQAGIPTFIHNSITPVEKGKVVEYIGYNQYEGGRKCGEYAANLLKGKGKVVIIMGIPGFHNTERTGGFKDALKRYPGIEIVAEQPADWQREKAINVAAQALERTPDIALFFGASDEMAIGASLAAREKGKKVYTIGIDGNPNTLDAIGKGQVTATLGVYPEKMGETIVAQMKKALGGEKIPAFLETPGVIVDRQNLADYQAGRLWTQPIAGKAENIHQGV